MEYAADAGIDETRGAAVAPCFGLLLSRLIPQARRPRASRPSKPHLGRRRPLLASTEAQSHILTPTRFACLCRRHQEQQQHQWQRHHHRQRRQRQRHEQQRRRRRPLAQRTLKMLLWSDQSSFNGTLWRRSRRIFAVLVASDEGPSGTVAPMDRKCFRTLRSRQRRSHE